MSPTGRRTTLQPTQSIIDIGRPGVNAAIFVRPARGIIVGFSRSKTLERSALFGRDDKIRLGYCRGAKKDRSGKASALLETAVFIYMNIEQKYDLCSCLSNQDIEEKSVSLPLSIIASGAGSARISWQNPAPDPPRRPWRQCFAAFDNPPDRGLLRSDWPTQSFSAGATQ